MKVSSSTWSSFPVERLRDERGLRREDVQKRTSINAVTLYRIETARTRPQYRTLDTLLKLYGVPEDEQERLKTLYRQSADQGWIQPWHQDLREGYTAYISFEHDAHQVRNYSGMFVPGLLQTEDYARAVIRGGSYDATDEQVEDRVRTRVERQAARGEENPLKLWAVIDEAALRREVGGTDVMRAQLRHLLEAARAPQVTIQVIPFSSGAHPGMPGEFVVMAFDDALSTDLIYVDSQVGEIFLESDNDVERFRAHFDHLVAMAKSPDDSATLIAGIADGLE
ncbi:helix-turn-helix transcriptional regulator [Actinosynnema sp. NPDC023658]|uniref:helix-turn-helix domain-containing protein n=1 Tax=Actinosynnema sp. NPDC023658 TaxID=3155465 RepID=UPI0033EBFDEE